MTELCAYFGFALNDQAFEAHPRHIEKAIPWTADSIDAAWTDYALGTDELASCLPPQLVAQAGMRVGSPDASPTLTPAMRALCVPCSRSSTAMTTSPSTPGEVVRSARVEG
jgi:hypothetical protein